jgi:hypothetical protein
MDYFKNKENPNINRGISREYIWIFSHDNRVVCNNNNNNNSVEQCFLSEANSRPAAQFFPLFTESEILLTWSKQYDTKTENWIQSISVTQFFINDTASYQIYT